MYAAVFFAAVATSGVFTPVMRNIAIRLKLLDYPNSSVKTHQEPVPYLGGLAVWLSFLITVFLFLLATKHPDGNLQAVRGLIFGSIPILIIGIIDDLHPKGINYLLKFVVQFIAAGILVLNGIKADFINPNVIAIIVSLVWVVGITNAFNLIDIKDGLASSVAIISSLGFLLLSLPADLSYVKVVSVALIGACLGFLPYNLSKNHRIFLGDSGSLFLGFVLSAMALGAPFSSGNKISVFAPLLVLAIPIYETLLLIFYRLKRGKSPFMGSKDHFALRMEKMGLSQRMILLITVMVALALSVIAFISTRIPTIPALGLYMLVCVIFVIVSLWLGKVEVN